MGIKMSVKIKSLEQRILQLEAELAELKQRERVQSHLIQGCPDILYRTDLSGITTFMNAAAETLSGFSPEDLIGKPMGTAVYVDPKIRQQFTQDLQEKGFIRNFVNQLKHKDGSTWWGSANARIFFDESGNPAGIEGSVRDVTTEIEALSTLRESEEKFRTAFKTSPDAINLNRLSDGVYIDINDGFTQIMGYERSEVIGASSLELDIWKKDQDRATLVKGLQKNGYVENLEAQFVAKSGDVMWGLMSARVIEIDSEKTILSITRDITEKKHAEEERLKFEEQMIQTQKLESLGVLAGGVAHDFNNLLAAVMGHSELAKRRLPAESPVLDNLQQIEQAAEQAADLAKQMLAYSGKGKFVTKTVDLNLLLEEMLHILQVSISKKAVLRLNPYSPLPAIDVDATQLRQIVMNLVLNASEAIGEKSGVISITTGCMDCDQSYLRNVWLAENLHEGLYVYLEVADTGCGMDKEILPKIFDPFFTTKFTGRGLGMSAVMGIVKGHRGAIKVYSECGKGTTFKILLPASEKPAEIFNGVTEDDGWEGSGKALLVDDEESVRGVGFEMLKELGFTPITANNGLDALQVFKDNPDIVLVLLDLTMPKMDGEQCYRELREINPDIKVIMSSGYNELEVSQKFAGKGIAGFVQKPYKLSVLRSAIRNADL